MDMTLYFYLEQNVPSNKKIYVTIIIPGVFCKENTLSRASCPVAVDVTAYQWYTITDKLNC
jgi:hypothetical protein